MQTTYSLAEVADMVLPAEWTDGVRWLARRINRGEIQGTRFGHKLRMTEQQINDMLARYSTTPAPAPAAEQQTPAQSERPIRMVDGLSARSRRQLRSA
jgi:hypothetical protein